MAEVERKPQRTNHKGAVPTVVSGMSSADTQLIPNKGGDVILRVINGAAEATKVTVVTPGEVGGNLVADLEVEVAATTTKLIGPFDPAVYNNASGFLEVKLSKVTTVTLEATRVAV
jgi:hypothetical protein